MFDWIAGFFHELLLFGAAWLWPVHGLVMALSAWIKQIL